MVVDGEGMIERPRRVILLIDYDNLQICAARDTPGRDLQLTPVVQLAQRYGTVIMARAYAEWNLSTERLAVYKAGIEPAFAPVLRTESDRSGKSLADTVMVAEGMDMLWTLSPDVVVLATSDKDLIPLVRVAKQRGAFVVVLGSDFTAIPLREMADEHVTYRQLINEASGRFATEAGPARQPAALPEPTRRRPREHTTRERTAASGTTTPSSSAVAPTVPPRTERPQAEAAGTPAPEPVAPVTGGLAAEGDAQAGVRRRRRRGSRRRSDRIGAGGEAGALEGVGDGEGEGEGDEEFGAEVDDDLEITPTTSIAEVAQASSGTVEGPPDEGVEAPARVIDASPIAVEPEQAGSEPVTYSVDTEAPPEPVPAAKPRDRRRRTRRATSETAEPTVEPVSAGADASPPDGGVSVEGGELPPPPAAEAEPPAPAPEEVHAASEPTPNGEEQAPAAPARRPRRVASARAGRTRATGR
jgi:uncharacterized LabA/DUF88 family protein